MLAAVTQLGHIENRHKVCAPRSACATAARCMHAVLAIIKDLFDLFLTIATIVLVGSRRVRHYINSRFASANGVIAAFWVIYRRARVLVPPPCRPAEMSFFLFRLICWSQAAGSPSGNLMKKKRTLHTAHTAEQLLTPCTGNAPPEHVSFLIMVALASNSCGWIKTNARGPKIQIDTCRSVAKLSGSFFCVCSFSYHNLLDSISIEEMYGFQSGICAVTLTSALSFLLVRFYLFQFVHMSCSVQALYFDTKFMPHSDLHKLEETLIAVCSSSPFVALEWKSSQK